MNAARSAKKQIGDLGGQVGEGVIQNLALPFTLDVEPPGEDILRRLTPLSGLQEDILQRLGLGAVLYGQLEIQAIGH